MNVRSQPANDKDRFDQFVRLEGLKRPEVGRGLGEDSIAWFGEQAQREV